MKNEYWGLADDMFFGAGPLIFERAKYLREHMTIAEKIIWEKISKNN